MNNLLKKLTPPEPLGQCDSNFIGMFQTVRFIQMMSLTFGLFTQVSDSGPLGPLVVKKMANRSPFRCPKILFGPFRWLKSFSVFSRTVNINEV